MKFYDFGQIKNQRAMMAQHISVLQTLKMEPFAVTVHDIIEEDARVGILTSKLGDFSLQDYVNGMNNSICSIELVRGIISKLTKFVARLHECGIIHRSLNLSAIGMANSTKSPGVVKVTKLGNFELACHIRNV